VTAESCKRKFSSSIFVALLIDNNEQRIDDNVFVTILFTDIEIS
jgi:hypothetical protein